MRLLVLLLAFTSLVCAIAPIASSTIWTDVNLPKKHHHKRSPIQLTTATLHPDADIHKRDTNSSSSAISSSSHSNSSSTTTSMPKLSTTSLSSSTTTSYSYSLDIPSANKNGSFKSNPFIIRIKAPENLVFIICGAVLGACALAALVVLLASYIIRRRTAKAEKEVYYHNPGFGGFGGSLGLQSSSSSFFEKSSVNSASSLLMLSRQNSMMLQQQSETSSSPEVSQQGRAYRSNVTGNRGSMFISPVLEFMNTQKSVSQFDLPLYNRNPENSNSSRSFMNSTNASVSVDYAHHEIEKERLLQSDTDSNTSHHHQERPKRMQRPPSQFLDDLINLQDNEKPIDHQ